MPDDTPRSRWWSRRSTLIGAGVVVVVVAVAAVVFWPDGEATLPTNGEVVRDSTEALDMINEALGGTQAVQDFVIFVGLSVATDEGQKSFYDEVLDVARSGASQPVLLEDRSGDQGLDRTWMPVSSLRGAVVDSDGAVVPTLSVDFGLLGTTEEAISNLRRSAAEEGDLFKLDGLSDVTPSGSETLVQIVTADYSERRLHMAPGDSAVISLSDIPSVRSGDTVGVSYLFGQTLPGRAVDEAGMSPHDLFVHRWNLGLVTFLGSDDGGPTLISEAGLRVGGLPEPTGMKPTVVNVQFATDSETDEDQPSPGEDEGTDEDGLSPELEDAILAWQKAGALAREVDELRFRFNIEAEEWMLNAFLVKAGIADLRELSALVGNLLRTVYDLGVHAVDFDPDDYLDNPEAQVSLRRFKQTWNVEVEEAVEGVLRFIRLFGMDPAWGTSPLLPIFPRDGLPMIVPRRGWYNTVVKRCLDLEAKMRAANSALRSGGEEQGAGESTTTSTAPPGQPSPACDPRPRPRYRGFVWGDPRLTTIDGKAYEIHGVGEFLFFDNGTATIQIRTQPIGEDLATVASVATRVGDVKVVLQMSDGAVPKPQTLIDGELIELDRGEAILVGGGALLFTEDDWLIVWPDGTLATIEPVGTRHFLVSVEPSGGTSTGLLGDGDGNPDNDFATRDGVQLAADADEDFSSFYSTYVDSWRISDEESLFVYAPGEGTATFTMTGYPSRPFTGPNLPEDVREAAEIACRESGITMDEIVAGCIVDFGVTGDPSFIFAAFLAQSYTESSLYGGTEPPPAFDGACPSLGDNTTMQARIEVDGVCYDFPGSDQWACSVFETGPIGRYMEGVFTIDATGTPISQYDLDDGVAGVILQFNIKPPDWLAQGQAQAPFINLQTVRVDPSRDWWAGQNEHVPMAILTSYTVDLETGVATGAATFFDRRRLFNPDQTIELSEGTFEIVCPP